MAAATMEKLSERLAIVGRTKPASVAAAATVQTDVIDMKYFNRCLFVFNLGDYGAGNDGSLAAGIYGEVSDAGGAFTVLVTGKSLTSGNFTGSTNDDSVGILEVFGEELVAQGFRYIRAKATPSAQALTLSILALGGDAKYDPAVNYDLARVLQIVS